MFRAATVHVYVFVFVTPVTTIGECLPVDARVTPPLLDLQVATYNVIAEPPFAGARNETVTRASPAVALGRAGRLGTVLGITAPDAAEAGPTPVPLMARTEQ